MPGAGLKDTKVLKIGKERQQHLRAYISDLDLAADQPQLLDGPRRARCHS